MLFISLYCSVLCFVCLLYTLYFISLFEITFVVIWIFFFFFFKQKTAYEMRISDWSSDVCSSDLFAGMAQLRIAQLDGLRALDPQQAILPNWRHVIDTLYKGAGRTAWGNVDASGWPTFLIEPGDTATVNVRQRGLPESRPSQLHLQRSLWLDFDGAGYSVRDQINGDIGSLRRPTMAVPRQEK